MRWDIQIALQAHRFCLDLNSGLIMLMNLSNAIIATAYFLMPVCMSRVVQLHWKKLSTQLRFLALGFGLFITACGVTHIMDMVVMLAPVYWLQGWLIALTALISMPVAIMTIVYTYVWIRTREL